MNFKNKTSNRSYTRAGATVAALVILQCGAARAQHFSARQSPQEAFSVAVSSSARLAAVMAAIRSAQPSQISWLAQAFGSEPEPSIRAWILRAAAQLNASVEIPLFEQGLKDTSAWVRLAAVECLGKAGGARAAADLARALGVEPNPGVRQSEAFWLGQIGDPSAVSALGRALDADGNRGVRLQAAHALRRIGTGEAKKALDRGRKDKSRWVREISGGH